FSISLIHSSTLLLLSLFSLTLCFLPVMHISFPTSLSLSLSLSLRTPLSLSLSLSRSLSPSISLSVSLCVCETTGFHHFLISLRDCRLCHRGELPASPALERCTLL